MEGRETKTGDEDRAMKETGLLAQFIKVAAKVAASPPTGQRSWCHGEANKNYNGRFLAQERVLYILEY